MGHTPVPPGVLPACALPNRRTAMRTACCSSLLQQDVMDSVESGVRRVIAV